MIEYDKISKAKWKVVLKDEISNLEYLGLERALEQLIFSFESSTYGGIYNTNINDTSYLCDGSLFLNQPYQMNDLYIHFICCDVNSIMLAYVTEDKNTENGYYMRLD